MRFAGKIRNAVLVATLAAALACGAHARSSPMMALEAEITLNPDGSALIVENIELPVVSGSFDREIRTHFPGMMGSRHLVIDVAEVSDGTGANLRFFTLQSAAAVTIRIPRMASRKLKIIYGVRNAAVFAGDHDEFFWIANDPSWAVEQTSIHLSLPAAAANQFRAQSFLRPESPTSSPTDLWSYNGLVPLQISGTELEAGAPGPLAPGVDMVVNVFLAKGILSAPNALVRAGWFLHANPVIFLPVGAWLVMLVLRRIKPPADAGRSVAPMYQPPNDLSPAEVGILIDDRLDPRDICATLIDLAVRGYVKLEEEKPQAGSFNGQPDYFVRLLKPMPEWGGLRPHERTMLFHTFYGGYWTKLSSLRLRFPEIVPYMKINLLQSLKQKHMYRVDPETAQAWRLAGLFAVGALLVFAQALGLVALADSPALSGMIMLVSAFVVYWMGRDLSAKTLRGMKTWIAIRGFEEFLRATDGDRLKRLQPDLFEKYLPYAMALGIEHRWTSAFQGIAIQHPTWVDQADSGLGMAGGLFDTVGFGHRLDLMFHQAILSAPRGQLLQPVATMFAGALSRGRG